MSETLELPGKVQNFFLLCVLINSALWLDPLYHITLCVWRLFKDSEHNRPHSTIISVMRVIQLRRGEGRKGGGGGVYITVGRSSMHSGECNHLHHHHLLL